MKQAGAAADAILRAANLRLTPVRLGVLRVLSASGRPLGVTQILAELPEHTDAVTVYRTLNTFIKHRLVHRVRGEDRSWLFALGDPGDTSRHRHPHFVCEKCGKVECLVDADIPAGLVRSMGVGRGYTVHYPEVVLHGLCPKCGS